MPDVPPKPRLCVLGSLNMDLVVRCPHLPKPGETVLGSSYKTYPGGKGANQAVAAARLGASVSIIGRVGDDAHGPRLRSVLEADHVNTTHLHTTPDTPSGLGMITVEDSGENTIVVASGANSLVSIEDVRAAKRLIESADALLLQLEIPMATNVEAAALAHAAGKAVVLNAAPARMLPADLLKSVDVLVVNRHEAATLTGQDPHVEPGRLALRLPELKVPAVLLTLGAQGSILVHKGRVRRVPTPRVQAVDAVGAGDAFVGALAVHWVPVHHAARTKSPDEFKLAEDAALRASAAGALATTKPGAIPSLPKHDEVESLAVTLRIGA